MNTKTVKIIDPSGIHARPATVLVGAAGGFESDLKLEYNGNQVNLKSVMGVMSLAIPNGAEVTILADGADADAAIAGIYEAMKKEGLSE
ncbi:phosphocarrier protein HPr [Erysipelotrichaceae bacterium]|nr:phosphocarrier protein HPr [Erysipelotrichaceae bacterium]